MSINTWPRDQYDGPGGGLYTGPGGGMYTGPGGGLSAEGTWLPAGKSFLLPVKALSRIFRAKFRDALRKTACFYDIPSDV